MDKATQNKRKKDTSYHPETHVRDVNSRDIFKNNILASQFLKNVNPQTLVLESKNPRILAGIEQIL